MNVLLFADVGGREGFYHVGDEAMLEVTHAWYRKNYPKCKITILSKTPLKPQHLNWPIDRFINRGYFFIMSFKTLIWRLLKINIFSKKEFNFIKLVNNADRIHFTGGGNITSLFTPWLYYSLFVIFLGWLLNKQIILTSQTIGPFWGIDRLPVFIILNLPYLIVLREEINNKKYGIFFPKLKGMVDAAYFLPAKEIIHKPNGKKIRIGLSLHYWQGFNHMKLIDQTTQVLNKISLKYQIEIVIIPHVFSSKKYRWSDMNLMNLLIKKQPKKIKVIRPTNKQIFRSKSSPAVVIKELTASVDFLMTTRYHGTVFALASNVPSMSLVMDKYYQLKFENILKMFYKEEAKNHFFSFDAGYSYKKLYETIQNLIDSLSNEKKKLIFINKQLLKRNDLFYLDELLKY